ncbi:RNA polymerase sigma factor [Alteromonas lipolytica]|uniref:RNA polymerase subunit sigma-70 n=1 Tax=Alteromonas lipolytica TaxID=1856405 RepID=A0A1E8FKJ0_9ALTE|nr:RNA polymerase sigma factor [Alteromonas lipolytica]OFI35953.1 RNA polymerase subunit sigma-70 [Alteromonas lipolytica]GGF72208.1 hypothetical protein GCM10011338_25580 [Alteromonas lipolytica]
MSGSSKIAATYLKYRTRLMRAVSNIVDDNDIEDIVQDAFVKSYEAELKQDIEYERTYMLRTVRNLALNHVSRSAHKLNDQVENMDLLLDSSHDASPEHQTESKQRFIHFCQATESLSTEVKRVFLLKKVYDMSQRDIAELLQLSESTVEKHVAKGLMQCAQFLARQQQPQRRDDSQSNLG